MTDSETTSEGEVEADDHGTLSHPETEDEVMRRLPEVEWIEDEGRRGMVVELFREEVPEYFWEAPATSWDVLHNPMCRGRHGLWVHTKLVATAYERLCETEEKAGRVTAEEVDMGRAAVLLHDTHKYGAAYEEGKSAAADHDVRAAQMVEYETDGEVDDRLLRAMRSHMGPFEKYSGPVPQTPLERLVHNADMVGSARFVSPAVFDPCIELALEYPSMTTYEADDRPLPWE